LGSKGQPNARGQIIRRTPGDLKETLFILTCEAEAGGGSGHVPTKIKLSLGKKEQYEMSSHRNKAEKPNPRKVTDLLRGNRGKESNPHENNNTSFSWGGTKSGSHHPTHILKLLTP